MINPRATALWFNFAIGVVANIAAAWAAIL